MAKRIEWTPQARADVRRIDRDTALGLLEGLAEYALTGYGDVERLQDVTPPELRLRVGVYRVRFYDYGDCIQILLCSSSPRGLWVTVRTTRITRTARAA